MSKMRRKVGQSLFLLSILLPAMQVSAQILENPVEGPLSLRARVVTGTDNSASIDPSVSISLNNLTLSLSNSELPSYPQNTTTEFDTLVLDEEYDCVITSTYVGKVEVYFDVPQGLRVLLDGRPLVTHEYDGGNTANQSSETIKVVVTSGRPPLAPGEEFTVKSEYIFWGVSMGRLSDGSSAGMITIREDTFSDDLYTPGCLKYALGSNEEVEVVMAGDDLRQIKTESILADIVVTSLETVFEIRFYKKGDYKESLSGGLYPVFPTADPFVKHLISNASTPPEISITASDTAIHVGQSVTITATASDSNGSIAEVKFYRNSTLVTTDTSSPYTYTYSNATAGTHTFYAIAKDDDDNTTTSSSVSVSVTVNSAPSVSISASSSAIHVGQSVTITATASDTDGSIANVKFYRNTTLMSTDTSSPYTYTYSNATAGTHTFYAIAKDDDNATTTSTTVSVSVNAYPSVSISASPTSLNEGGSVTLTATASDTDGSIANVKFYRGTTLVKTDTSSPYNYTYSNATAGSHSFYAIAKDNDNATTTSTTVSVSVNAYPSVSISASPTAIHAGQSVTLTATASDTDGSIANVKFYRGTTLVKTDTSSPYNYTYSNATAGSHSFYAIAKDNDNATTTSTTVSVSVNAYPSVSISASPTAIHAGQSVTLTATASDTDGSIANVKFYRGTTLVKTDTSSPYNYTYSNATAGSHSFYAIAKDNDNATTTSTTVSVSVNAYPSVSISASPTSLNEGGSVTLTATASDTDGTISSVKFYRGTTLVKTDTSSPYNYTYSNATAGSHSFYAIAKDNDNATTTSTTVSVSVNAYPSVSISASPTSLNEGGSVTLTATASDTDGTISSVKFYHGTTLKKTDTSSPYNYLYSNAVAGSQSFYAVAKDNDNATTSTTTVSVSVNAYPTVSVSANDSLIDPGDSVTITATASDSDGTISEVKIYRNSTLVVTDTSSPYTYTYSNAAAGNHTFYAIAKDDDNATTTSSSIIVIANPVTVSGGLVDDYFNLSNDGFVEIEFNSNGNAYKTEGGSRTQIATSTDWVRPTSLAGSAYEIKATKGTYDPTPAGSSLDTWISFATGGSWSLSASYFYDGENDVGCVLTITIRDAATNTVLDSGSYTLTNFYNPEW